MNEAKSLDQFYTKQEVANNCVKIFKRALSGLRYELSDVTFLEPSAGTGAFLRALSPEDRWLAGDLEPKFPGVVKNDFFESSLILPKKENVVVLGNPPFGKRSKLALSFLKKSLEISETVGFILPLQFRKYITQRALPDSTRLIVDEDCPKNSFVFAGKPYDVRCCFQVWTSRESSHLDLRIRSAPPTNHPDFTTWIYNATKEAETAFDEDWELVVRRQGWGSFKPQLRKDNPELSKKVQWIFIKPHSEEAKKNLLSLDYEAIARKNTSVLGFGKADLVKEYTKKFGRKFRRGLF